MTIKQHVRTLLGPLIMAAAMFTAFAAQLADKPHWGLATVFIYTILWLIAPRVATVIAIMTLAFVAGDLIGSLLCAWR
jgi:hypothetical protein